MTDILSYSHTEKVEVAAGDAVGVAFFAEDKNITVAVVGNVAFHARVARADSEGEIPAATDNSPYFPAGVIHVLSVPRGYGVSLLGAATGVVWASSVSVLR